MPSGTSGTGAAIAASGSQSKSRRTCSTACSSRRRISASSTSSLLGPLAQLGRAASRPPTGALRRPSSRRPASRAASDCWRRRVRSRSASASISPVRDASRVGDLGDRVAALLHRGPPGAGPGFLVGPHREPGLDLGQAGVQHRAALLDRRAAQLVVAPQRARPAARRRSISARRVAGLVALLLPRPRAGPGPSASASGPIGSAVASSSSARADERRRAARRASRPRPRPRAAAARRAR